MTRYLLWSFIILLLGCGNERASDYPDPLAIKPDEQKFKKGDCLEFKIDSLTYGVGIVYDLSKDEGGTWYGLLLTDYESEQRPEMDSMINRRLPGRKVESSLNARGYELTLDAEYVHDSLLANNFIHIGNIPIKEEVKLGAHGASAKMSEFVTRFKNSQQRRVEPPDDYREHVSKLDKFRPDEYFELKDFVDKRD